MTSEDVWPDDIAADDRGNVWIAELRGKVHHYDAQTGETRQIAQIETTDPGPTPDGHQDFRRADHDGADLDGTGP